MENITIIESLGVQHVIIDKGNNEFESMTKEEYDRRQAEQSTPILPEQVCLLDKVCHNSIWAICHNIRGHNG